MRYRYWLMICSYLIICGLFGCSGGGGGGSNGEGSNPAAVTVTGLAASGDSLVGTVYLKDSSSPAKEISQSVPPADGSWFSFDVTNHKAPYFLKAVGTSDGKSYTLYSFASADGIYHVNPLTNLAVVLANGGNDPASLYANPDPTKIQSLANNLPAAIVSIQKKLDPIFSKYLASSDFMSYYAFFANHSGLDLLFDLVSVSSSNGKADISDKATGITILSSSLTGNAISGTIDLSSIPPMPLQTGTTTGTTCTISGKVVDSVGKGIPGIFVSVSGAGSGSTVTDANGNYNFSGIDGSYNISSDGGGYSFTPTLQTIVVSSANVTAKDFIGTKAYQISGIISTTSGSPLADVKVTATGNSGTTSTTTDILGMYSFYKMVNGSYSITASNSSYTFTPASLTVVVNNADTFRNDFTASSTSATGGSPAGGNGGGSSSCATNDTTCLVSYCQKNYPAEVFWLNLQSSLKNAGYPDQKTSYCAAAALEQCFIDYGLYSGGTGANGQQTSTTLSSLISLRDTNLSDAASLNSNAYNIGGYTIPANCWDNLPTPGTKGSPAVAPSNTGSTISSGSSSSSGTSSGGSTSGSNGDSIAGETCTTVKNTSGTWLTLCSVREKVCNYQIHNYEHACPTPGLDANLPSCDYYLNPNYPTKSRWDGEYVTSGYCCKYFIYAIPGSVETEGAGMAFWSTAAERQKAIDKCITNNFGYF